MTKFRNALHALVLKTTGAVPVPEVEGEEGQTLVEYGLIIALIAIVAVGAMTFLSSDVTNVFSSVGSSL